MPARIPIHRSRHAPAPVPAAVARAYRAQAGRLEANRFYASAAWRKLRAAFLAASPLCRDCEKAGRITLASHVHHVEERKDRPDLSLEWDNLESACPPCHNAKRREDRNREDA